MVSPSKLATISEEEISADGSFITVITDIAIEPRPGIQLLELNDKIVGIALTLLRSDEFLKLYDSGPCVSRYYNASIRFTVRVAEEGMVVCCHGDEWHFPQPCTCLSDSLMLKLAQIRKSKHICELEVEKYNSRNLVLLDPENHIEIFLYTCAYSHLHRKELIVGLQRDVFSRFQTYPRVRMAADEGSPAWMIHGLDGSTDEVDVDELTSAVGEVKLTPQDAGWARQKDVVPTTDQAAREDEEANGGERHKWASEDPKYEHVGDPATAGAEHLELEKVLFNHKNRAVPGNFITVYDEFDVSTSTSGEKLNPLENLDDARINAIVRENIKRCGYQDPLPIQKFAIPYLLDARDVIGVAQTGSGKTAAFLIPLISRLLNKGASALKRKPNPSTYDESTDGICAEPCVLIVVPTRELACQIAADARALTYKTPVRVCSVYGGADKRVQMADLRRGADLLVGTPGRLADFLVNHPTIVSLRRAKYTVIDEADEILTDDWAEAMAPILSSAAAHNSDDSVFVMFSATFGRREREEARKYMSEDSVTINVGRLGSTIRNIHQVIVWINQELKYTALADCLRSVPQCRTIVFCNTIKTVDNVDDFLFHQGFPTNTVHSSRSQRDRETILKDFNSGETPIIIATSVYARGMDLHKVEHIINFDLPSRTHGGITEYIHRIGRTGRIGARGQSTSFFNDRNEDLAPALVNLLLENEQKVEDFLDPFRPADGVPNFEESDEDGAGVEVDGETGNDGWGSPAGDD